MDDLLRSLTRARDALAKDAPSPQHAPPDAPVRQPGAAHMPKVPEWAFSAVGAAALVLIVLGLVFHNHAALRLGIVLATVGAGLLVTGHLQPRRSAPGIRMGASIGRGARVDPAAAIETWAAVGAGARIGPHAVVRAGSNVGRDAVVEPGAVISYGASIGRGAVIGEGAAIGAGAQVAQDAHVPAGMVVRPGSTFQGGPRAALAARATHQPGARRTGVEQPSTGQIQPEAPRDPRAVRVAAVCSRLEAGLRESPQSARDLLGESSLATVAGLRSTCEQLLVREAWLRREAQLGQLPEERLAIERRLEREEDGQIRESLRGALAAIDGQVKERERLRLAADRIAAEHMRLLYTLEELGAQLARLRSAGDGAKQPAVAVPAEVAQLRAELEAMADALESVAAPSGQGESEPAAVAGPVENDKAAARAEHELPGSPATRVR